MTKQLDDMWSSKWVLPEHREALIEDELSLKFIPKTVLDEQEIAIVNEVIGRSLHTQCSIILTIYGVYQHRTLTGHVARIDHQLKQIKFILFLPYVNTGEWEWIPLQDILNAEVKESVVWGDDELDW